MLGLIAKRCTEIIRRWLPDPFVFAVLLTNLLQPFFLLTVPPVMGAGVRIQARDVVGYYFVPFLMLFGIVGLLVTFFPM